MLFENLVFDKSKNNIRNNDLNMNLSTLNMNLSPPNPEERGVPPPRNILNTSDSCSINRLVIVTEQ